jgi:Xaa-Pro aminopeptidase
MKLQTFQNYLSEKNIDLALILSFDEKPNTSMVYFTNYLGIGILCIFKKNAFLLVPDMEYERASISAKDSKIKVYKTEKKKKMLETLSLLISRQKADIKRIGIDEDSCAVYLYKKLRKAFKGKYVDIYGALSRIRMQKDNAEIEKIKKACSVTDQTFTKICNNFKFKTESELSSFIVEEIEKNNCDLAFPPIVASGEASSQPHYNGTKKLKKGFLLLDFGAKYKGYCADMTRMLYLGNPTKDELDNYKLVLKVVTDCEKATENEKKYSAIYQLAIKILGDKAVYFIHGLGHGLGLDIHELPSLTSEDKNDIQNNIPFTIEPGIYFQNKYGIRIEDTLIIKDNVLTVLTKSKKDLVIFRKNY